MRQFWMWRHLDGSVINQASQGGTYNCFRSGGLQVSPRRLLPPAVFHKGSNLEPCKGRVFQRCKGGPLGG